MTTPLEFWPNWLTWVQSGTGVQVPPVGPSGRSKVHPAGFAPQDPQTAEQTSLAVRTAFLLTLALLAGGYISREQPGWSVMFELHAFRVLLSLGCCVTSRGIPRWPVAVHVSLRADILQCKEPSRGRR